MDPTEPKIEFAEFKPQSIGMAKDKAKALPKNTKNRGFDIVPFETKKDSIKKHMRPAMRAGIIPPHPASVIFNGRSGSGKSNLMINLLTRPEFYGQTKPGEKKTHFFDDIYLFSPTAGDLDDLTKHMLDYTSLTQDHVFNTFDETKLFDLLDTQAADIRKKGDIGKSKKVLIILDDIQSSKKFLASNTLKRMFIANRHYNVSVWLGGQSWTLTPRCCRLQANNVFIFPMSGSEAELLMKEFSPAGMKKKDFEKVLMHATAEQYQFLHINMKHPAKTRFRKNLGEILELTGY